MAIAAADACFVAGTFATLELKATHTNMQLSSTLLQESHEHEDMRRLYKQHKQIWRPYTNPTLTPKR